jgi:tetratricopeptide (TPR) repeat protein
MYKTMKTSSLVARLGLGLTVILAAGQLGCPPSADLKGPPPLSADSLPTDPEALLKVADEQFDSGPTGFKNAQIALQRAMQKNADWAGSKAGYGVQWRLARAAAEQCALDDGAPCSAALSGGVAAAKKATELEPGRVEGHYYLAQLQGFTAQTQKGGGETKPLLQQLISEGELAIKADDKFDYGGPYRMLGTMYARAPAPPVAVGDPEKAIQNLQKAVAIAPDYPPNQIYLAEALIADERYADAEAALAAARKLLADSKWDKQRDLWKDLLSRVERKLRAKQG